MTDDPTPTDATTTTTPPSPASDPLAAVAWPVRTERLTIRRARADDLETVWRTRRDPEVARWVPGVPGAMEEWRAAWEEPGRIEATLMVELDGQVVGDLMLRVEDAWAQIEVQDDARGVQGLVGWELDAEHLGQGYGTEAVRELLRIAFDELGLRRVVADCYADNVASWRLMERLGMRREAHTIRSSLHRDGRWLDDFAYALLADEWRAARERDVPDN